MAARSALTRLHMFASPGPLVVDVFPATYRAPSRAALEVAIANVYPRPSSTTPATSRTRMGRVMANSTNAWPRPLRGSAIHLQVGRDDSRQVCGPSGNQRGG